jgi:hypothetical protein
MKAAARLVIRKQVALDVLGQKADDFRIDS